MITLGIIFLLIGYLAGVSVLVVLGWIIAVLGFVALFLGSYGHPIRGRRWYY